MSASFLKLVALCTPRKRYNKSINKGINLEND